MPEISILAENCGGQNKNNVMICFINIIKDGGFSGADTLNIYIKGHIKITWTAHLTELRCCNRSKISLVLRSAVNFFSSQNVKVIQIFHEIFFELEQLLNDRYNRPDTKTVNINHVFQLKKQLVHIGYHPDFHGEAESEQNFNRDNACRNS